jgi:acyl-CoA thioester hydrolase
MRADRPATSNGRHSLSLRVPPRYCDAQGMVHAVRYYELFEEAFLSWLEHARGGYPALQATGGDLVIAENGCTYRHPAWQNERATIEVDPVETGPSGGELVAGWRRPVSAGIAGRMW